MDDLIEICTVNNQQDEGDKEGYNTEYMDNLEDDDSDNQYNIFMNIPLEDRLDSDYFDFEVSSLESTLVDKQQIKIAVEKILILSDIGLKEAKAIVGDIINDLSVVTTYEGYSGDSNIEKLLAELVG
ncbi:hypothetical protein [Piscirickettsia litoralis]|uniref:hypothetical protein n=1 Tax=Piscirickettsia litoralis TaxID=1891921 RepID=UPI001112F230|nr:hypothetical protein [Piscirickettsia litoralis]